MDINLLWKCGNYLVILMVSQNSVHDEFSNELEPFRRLLMNKKELRDSHFFFELRDSQSLFFKQ